MSSNRIVQQALNNQKLWDRGAGNMWQQWIDLHYGPDAQKAVTAPAARCGLSGRLVRTTCHGAASAKPEANGEDRSKAKTEPACRGGVGGGS